MDFLDPKKTRRLTIQLFIGYFLVTVMVVLATAILVHYSYGYNVNRKGDLVQKGLVFVSSQPSGARLFIDNKQIDTTNAKLNLQSGKYKLTLKRDGYRDWSRNIIVDGGDVSHYVYPLLIPNRLQTNELKTFDTAPALTSQSPDRRWLVALTDVNTGTFEVFDLNRKQNQVAETVSFSVPNNLMTASTGAVRWEVLEWSTNNRHMLLKRHFVAEDGTEQFEYILADRQRPDGSYNLSRELRANPTELTLRDKKPDSYYLYDATTKELSTASLGEPRPVVVVKEVEAYKTHDTNTVVYATTEGAEPGKVSIKVRQRDKEHTIRNVTTSEKYLLDIARYEGDWYVVLGSQVDSRVYIYKNPVEQIQSDKKPEALYALRLNKPISVSFSANAQFVLTQNGKAFHIYDLENVRSYRYSAKYPVDEPQSRAQWMDSNRLTYASGGKQVIFDYDNINRRELAPASATYLSAFDREYRYLYTFTQNDSGALVLSSTALRTQNDL